MDTSVVRSDLQCDRKRDKENTAVQLILDIADRFGLRVEIFDTEIVHASAASHGIELTEEEAGDILGDIIIVDDHAIESQVRDIICDRYPDACEKEGYEYENRGS